MRGRKEMRRFRDRLEVGRKKLVVGGFAVLAIITAVAFTQAAVRHNQSTETVGIDFVYEPSALVGVGGAKKACDSARREINRANQIFEEAGDPVRFELRSCRPAMVLPRGVGPKAYLDYEEVLRATNLLLGVDFDLAEEPTQLVSIGEGPKDDND